MTDREEFEKWFKAEWNADYYPTEAMYLAWQARGELDAVRIEGLEAELAEWKEVGLGHDENSRQAIKQLAELTGKLDKARKALHNISNNWSEADAIAVNALKELDK